MFFELFLLRKISEFPAGLEPTTFRSPVRRSNHWYSYIEIAQWLERLTGDLKVVGSSPAGNSDIFLSKNSSKNIIIIIWQNISQYFVKVFQPY